MVSAFCEKPEALESLRSTSAGLGKHLDGVSDKPDEPSKPKERKKNAGFSATASQDLEDIEEICLLYTSPSPRDLSTSRMPSSA